jgi:hypothetical protein
MHGDSSQCAVTKAAARRPGVRALRRSWALDRRTSTAKRLHAIMLDLARQHGIAFDINDAALRRAGELIIAAELGRRDLIRERGGINVDLLLRLEGCAARACRDLASNAHAKPNAEADELGTYLAGRAAAKAVKAADDDAETAPAVAGEALP